jgi:TonB-dependent receptor
MNSSRKTAFAYSKAMLLAATCLASGVATQAQAQTTPTPGAGAVDEVIVTGFRRSLAESTQAKRESSSFQDSIFAEDIGKFPDTNLAESLNRIPGVQLTREITGEGLNIAIRGLGTNFTKILLNGNQIAVASTGRTDSQNQNREVDLDVFPTELFNRLDVNKTPVANMLEGGVSGTVNMRSARPFDNPGRSITYTVQGNFNENSEEWSPRGALIASQTWDTGWGQFGVLAGIAVARNKVLTEGFETIGWTNATNVVCTGCNTNGGNGFNFATSVPLNAGNGLTAGTVIDNAFLTARNPGTSLQQLSDGLIPRLGRPSYSKGRRDRDSALISIEYKPGDKLSFYFDTLLAQAERKFERVDVNWVVRNSNAMVPLNVKVDANNVVTAGTFANSQFFLEYRPYEEDLEFFNLNPGFSWQVNDWIKVDGQLNMSKSQFKREAPTVLINTPLNTGVTVTYDNTGAGPFPAINTNVDLNDPNLGWTWAGGRVNIQNEERVTKTKGAHLDAMFGDENLNLKIGGAFDEARRSIIARDNSPAWQQAVCGGGGTFFPAPAPQPACDGRAGSAVTQSQLASFLRPGPGFITVDGDAFKAATNYQQFSDTAPFSAAAATAARSGIIKEQTVGGYVEFNGKSEFNDFTLRYNAGVRYISTEQDITGPFTPPGAPAPTGFQTLGSRYDAYLPSFNAALELPHNLLFRVAASRTLTRPDPSAMLPGTTFVDPSAQNANQGNANLTPFKSNNFDAGLEWYTGQEGYVGVVGFQKEVTGFTIQGTTTVPFTQLGIPFGALTPNQQQAINNRGGPNVATVTVTQQVNAGGVLTIRGYELNWVQPLSFLLDGLGFTANYTRIYQSASGAGAPPVAIGVSPYTYNLTGYYEKGPASIRMSWTYNDKQISSTPNQNSVPVAQLRTDARGQLDLSASYEFDWLPTSPRVTLDVINITDEEQRQTFEYPNAAFTYYKPGRAILLGIRGKF